MKLFVLGRPFQQNQHFVYVIYKHIRTFSEPMSVRSVVGRRIIQSTVRHDRRAPLAPHRVYVCMAEYNSTRRCQETLDDGAPKKLYPTTEKEGFPRDSCETTTPQRVKYF